MAQESILCIRIYFLLLDNPADGRVVKPRMASDLLLRLAVLKWARAMDLFHRIWSAG